MKNTIHGLEYKRQGPCDAQILRQEPPDQLRLESKIIGLLISGGLDSSILLKHLLNLGQSAQPFYIRSGLKMAGRGTKFVGAISECCIRPTP